MANLKKLTNRHYNFIDIYLANGQNGAAAYREAFNIDNIENSKRKAYILLKDPLIIKEIEIKREEIQKKYDIKKDRIIKELVDIIDFNVLYIQTIKQTKEIVKEINLATGELEEKEIITNSLETNLNNLTLAQQKNIKSIELLKNGTFKIQYYDRLDAIDKLNKMLNFYENSVSINTTIDTSSLQGLSTEELKKLVDG